MDRCIVIGCSSIMYGLTMLQFVSVFFNQNKRFLYERYALASKTL